MKPSRPFDCLIATALLSISCAGHAMISVSSVPIPPPAYIPDAAQAVPANPDATNTVPINKGPAPRTVIENEAAAKAAKFAVRNSWIVPLPGDTKELCMAGVCLGDSIDSLPTKSANSSGSRVKGDWLQLAKTDQEIQNGFGLSLNAQFQIFEDMRDTVYVCSLSELALPLTPRMHLVFFPEDASPSGIEVVVDLLPKRRDTTKSIYAVTQIQLNVSQGNPDEAVQWTSSIAKLWPSMKPQILAEKADEPEQIFLWSTRDVSSYEDKTQQGINAVVYKVSPPLLIGNDQLNAQQWDHKPVTHQLQWDHGVYGLDLVTLAQTRAVEQTLRKQKGCENPKNTKAARKDTSKEMTN